MGIKINDFVSTQKNILTQSGDGLATCPFGCRGPQGGVEHPLWRSVQYGE